MRTTEFTISKTFYLYVDGIFHARFLTEWGAVAAAVRFAQDQGCSVSLGLRLVRPMPNLIVNAETLRLIASHATPGWEFQANASPFGDGRFELPVDDEVYSTINRIRQAGESDDQVIARVVGRLPN